MAAMTASAWDWVIVPFSTRGARTSFSRWPGSFCSVPVCRPPESVVVVSLEGAVVSGEVGEVCAEASPLPPVRTKPAPAPAVRPARPMAARASCFLMGPLHFDGKPGRGVDATARRPSSTSPVSVRAQGRENLVRGSAARLTVVLPAPRMVPLMGDEGAKLHVLVAEDDRGLRESLVRVLRFEGYEVEAVSDGAKALEAVDRARPRRGGARRDDARRRRPHRLPSPPRAVPPAADPHADGPPRGGRPRGGPRRRRRRLRREAVRPRRAPGPAPRAGAPLRSERRGRGPAGSATSPSTSAAGWPTGASDPWV